MPIQANHNLQKNVALAILAKVAFVSKFLLEKFIKYRVFLKPIFDFFCNLFNFG